MPPAPGERTGLGRLVRACRYSGRGLRAAFVHEPAFRQELVLAAVLVPAALALPVGGAAKALLVVTVLGVLVTELLNSAVESVVDRISLEEHELAGRAKDLGSAAVLVSLAACAAAWVLVLLDLLA